jgi:hypothetical protein
VCPDLEHRDPGHKGCVPTVNVGIPGTIIKSIILSRVCPGCEQQGIGCLHQSK